MKAIHQNKQTKQKQKLKKEVGRKEMRQEQRKTVTTNCN